MAKGDRAVEHGQDLILFAHDLAEPDSARRDHGPGCVLIETRRPLSPKSGLFVRQSKWPLRAILQTSPPYRV